MPDATRAEVERASLSAALDTLFAASAAATAAITALRSDAVYDPDYTVAAAGDDIAAYLGIAAQSIGSALGLHRQILFGELP